ncbi:hypothetical protein [Marinobacterium sp. xm-d-564]|uniref:hypothetical protein n=1 Tax=Marinobacterium sp. xm-d-564 TaxID=2497742 RepID=UPI001569205C|nr:hypothetical protein [Marinobacterium sp. xm-d-564]NRP60184.1 hypothetical protein [Marinobacterium sp. xm-d-564]
MFISTRALITFALAVIFYTAFKGAYYFMANRLQEVGFLLTFILFGYSALVAALNVKEQNLRWSFWVFTTLLFVAYTFVLPAYQFSVNAGVSMLPSMMASREFLIVFIAPTLYFLYRIGYKVEDINRVVLLVFAAIVFSYVFHYFRIDLEAAYNSSDPTIKGMTTHDEHRGYRLKAPQVALFLTTIISAYLMVTSESLRAKLGWGITFCVSVWIWSIIQARAPTAMMILGVLLYHLWFARKPRMGLLFLGMALIIPLYTLAIQQYFAVMEGADDGVRYRSYMIALNTVMDHPFFGYGQQSAATITEQEIFWYKFYSSDLGLIGVAFKFGITGALLYLALMIYTLKKAVTTNWLIIHHTGKANIFFVASIAKLITDIFNSLLSVHYVYIHGLAHASIIIALSVIYRLEYQNHR